MSDAHYYRPPSLSDDIDLVARGLLCCIEVMLHPQFRGHGTYTTCLCT